MGIPVKKSGVTIGSAVYEWINAAHWDNLSFDEFMRKPVIYKEQIIAAYRIKNQIAAVINKEIAK